MLICRNCGRDATTHVSSWKRKSGKVDYRCVCGSKLKPIEEIRYNEINQDIIQDTIRVSEISGGKILDTFPSYRNQDSTLSTLRQPKSILFIGDLHCGAKSGLTPPEYWVNPYDKKWRSIQEESWNFYSDVVNEIGYVDAVVVNGDSIDGKGTKSGGTELITTDLFEQVKIATRCLEEIDSNNYYFTYGTGYHISNNGDDFEVCLADNFDAVIKNHLWLDINDCIFDIKHKIGGSSVLSSRVSNLIKEFQWNREWVNINGAPKSDVFIRSHVHYHMSVKDPNSFLGMTLPALQAPNTKFGARECTGTVHFGCVLFEVPEDFNDVDDLRFTVYKKHLESVKSRSIKL